MEIPKKYKPNEIEDRWKEHWAEEKIYAWDPTRGRDRSDNRTPSKVKGQRHCCPKQDPTVIAREPSIPYGSTDRGNLLGHRSGLDATRVTNCGSRFSRRASSQ